MRLWIKNFITWYTGNKRRRFVHVSGFGDDTEYVEYDADGYATCVSNDGTRDRTGPTLDMAKRFVANGSWKEITW